MHDKKLYGTASVGTKGQVVIPSDAREALNIKPGDQLFVIGSETAGWVGFIKEEQFKAVIEKMSNNIENYKNIVNTKE